MAIANIQHNRFDPGNVATQDAVVLNATVAGNAILLGVMNGGTLSPTGVADTQAQTYTKAKEQIQTTDGNVISFWYKLNSVSLNNTTDKVTVTNNGTVSTRVIIAEYQGLAATNALDQTNSAQTGSAATSLDTGNITTTVANELLIVLFDNSSNAAKVITQGSGFTILDSVPGPPVAGSPRFTWADQVVSATGTYHSTTSQTTTEDLATIILSFADTPIGGGGTAIAGMGRRMQGIIYAQG